MMGKLAVQVLLDNKLFEQALIALIKLSKKYTVLSPTLEGNLVLQHIQETRPDIIILDIHYCRDMFRTNPNFFNEIHPARALGLSLINDHFLAQSLYKSGLFGYLPPSCCKADLFAALDIVQKGEKYISKMFKDFIAGELFNPSAEKQNNYSKILTESEITTIGFLRQGLSPRQIAEKVGLSVRTIEARVGNIRRKTNAKNINALLAIINDPKLM